VGKCGGGGLSFLALLETGLRRRRYFSPFKRMQVIPTERSGGGISNKSTLIN